MAISDTRLTYSCTKCESNGNYCYCKLDDVGETFKTYCPACQDQEVFRRLPEPEIG